MELTLDAPVGAILGEDESQQDAQVTWLDTGRVHLLLTQRLRVGSEWPLNLSHDTSPVLLRARVLAVRVRTHLKEGPRVLHLCSLLLPPEGHEGLETLLRQINPELAPPERPGPPQQSTAPRREKKSRSSRRRLPPQRRLSRHIPKLQQDDDAAASTPAPQRPATRSRGLSTAELVHPEFTPGEPPVLVASIPSLVLFDRCCRWGPGWLQLTLSDLDEVPRDQDVALELILPNSAQVHIVVHVARRSRGRMILEARELSRAALRTIEELV